MWLIDYSFYLKILQPKAIRNGAAYHQEIFYGQQTNNVQQEPQPVVRLNIPQTVLKPAPVPVPTAVPTVTARPLTTRTTTTTARLEVLEDEEFENTPRPAIRKKLPLKKQVVKAFPVTTEPTVTTERIHSTTEELTPEELEEQAKSAFYNFGTSVRDTINDHEHVRHEEREGLALKGMYSYSDGFFRRTVHYVADEGGYRVTKEEVEPINSDGPKFNPNGQAEVRSSLAGDYSITVDDFRLNKQQEKILENKVKEERDW